jgi:hypothetical protein
MYYKLATLIYYEVGIQYYERANLNPRTPVACTGEKLDTD